MKSVKEKDPTYVDLEASNQSGHKYKVTQSKDESITSNKKTLLLTLCILVTEMCERLTYYSITANLILFCTAHLDIPQATATTVNQVFSGFVYIVPIFGGFIADAYAGRFVTILVSCVLYIIGTLVIVASAVDYDTWGWEPLSDAGKRGTFFAGLVFIALGTGGIKANVGPFGAEQVESMGPGAVRSFFNWFYWVVNVGAFIAYAFVAYIQQNISFAWGFLVPFLSMTVACFIFVCARTAYVRTAPKGSVFTDVFKICRQGACKRDPPSNPNLPPGSEKKILASAKISFGGYSEDHLVDGVVSVIRVIPFCLLVIMYWALYSQMSNTFFAQSERMDVRLTDDFSMPAAALNIFDAICIIILVPFVDILLYPCFEKLGKPLSYLKRIGIGFILSMIGVLIAGVVEIYRKKDLEEHHIVQVLAGENFTASTMSVFVQVPQFALIGASEIFTSVTSLEFAYNQAPVSMQGLLTGLFLAASGFGNWVSTAIIAIVEKASEEHPWWGDEINDCKMEYLLFLLGGLMFVNFLIFCVVSHYYTYQDPATFEKVVDDDKTDNVDYADFPHSNGSSTNNIKLRELVDDYTHEKYDQKQ
ncbi:hypothetical protein BsWGS_06623 [Bradybaena similaris]